MSVRFDLTAITPQLMDAVIYMDNSPSYAAFKEEIEAILSDFNATGHLSSSWKINEQELTEKSEDNPQKYATVHILSGPTTRSRRTALTPTAAAQFSQSFSSSHRLIP